MILLSIIPNFIIGGAPRSGTTRLYLYLSQHPEIFLPKNKEPHYFTKYYFKKEDWYLSLFKKASRNIKSIGEASTQYIYKPSAPKRIYDFNKEMKIIFIIRNPIDRAYSNYKREVQMFGEKKKFKEIFQDSDRFINPGMYYTNIIRYLNYFNSEQIKILVFEEFIKNEKKHLDEIVDFLNISSFSFPKIKRNNSSVYPLSKNLIAFTNRFFYSRHENSQIIRLLRGGIREFMRYINFKFSYREFPSLSEEMKYHLKDTFYDDVNKLSNLIYDIDIKKIWGF